MKTQNVKICIERKYANMKIVNKFKISNFVLEIPKRGNFFYEKKNFFRLKLKLFKNF